MLITILLKQICMMALLIAVGIYLRKKNLLTEHGSKDLGAILLRVIIPCIIVKSYLIECSTERLIELLSSVLLAFVGFVIAMGIAYLVYGKRRRIENFAAAFCNAGFIGIPLVQAVIGEEGVFYVAASIALLNLFQWTYGVYIITDCKDAISLKTIAKNPVVISIVLGLLLLVTQIPVPGVVRTTLKYISGMNTPIAMILMGTYMSKLSLKQILLCKKAYGCVVFRLFIIPAVILLAFSVIPVRNEAIMLAAYLAAATPVGTNICVFAQQYECDYEFSVITVCLSTLLSIVSIPIMTSIAQLLM